MKTIDTQSLTDNLSNPKSSASPSMKRVLIISYYWPPVGGSGVQRWLKFAKFFPSLGWQPVVYTPENPEMALIDNTLLGDVPPQAEIVKRKIMEPYAWFRWFMRGKKHSKPNVQGQTINVLNDDKHKSLKMRLVLWIRANLFVPDPRCFWVKPSVKFLLKYLRQHPVDAMVSTGPPMSMHLIAMKLHRATGIRWVADFRDPWTGINYFKNLPLLNCSRRKHFRLEKSVLLEANDVVAVTSLMCSDFVEATRGLCAANKFHLIENGYDEDDFVGDVVVDQDFTILHTGIFFAERNPTDFWDALRSLCDENPAFEQKLRIELMGQCDKKVLASIEAAGLKKYLVNKGYVPHNEVNTRQRQARLLILPISFEQEARSALSGKFFEYLATGIPIMAFGLHNGSLDLALTRTGAGKLFGENEVEQMKLFVLNVFEGTNPINRNVEEIRRFSRRELAKKFALLLNSQV